MDIVNIYSGSAGELVHRSALKINRSLTAIGDFFPSNLESVVANAVITVEWRIFVCYIEVRSQMLLSE